MTQPNSGGKRKRDRGQTLQDYILGISIFIVAVVLVFSLLPGMLDPFDQQIHNEDHATSDRISESIVSNFSDPQYPNNLNKSDLQSEIFGLSETQLKNKYDLSKTTQVNITLESMNGSTQYEAAGHQYAPDQTAKSVRLVNVEGYGTACRLIVKTW